MMKKLLKLQNNLFSTRAFSALGPALYLRYLATAAITAREILRRGNLRQLDQAMGTSAKRFRFRGSTFLFDCEFCDSHAKEDSFAFGIAREIYIRDCYFKWHPPSVYENAKVVVDLGANRGAFSTLMTSRADFILSVECQEHYIPIIQHNLHINKFDTYSIENSLIGDRGKIDSNQRAMRVQELFAHNGLDRVDLIKMDIEGSEFSLFSDSDWLQRVNALSMEVHRQFGDPREIIKKLIEHGFRFVNADENLHRVTDPERADFIYAWKPFEQAILR